MVVWTVSRGAQEYLAPRYHAPSVALHRAPSESLVTHRSADITQLSTHTSVCLIDNAPALKFKFKLYELSQTSTVISDLFD